jgi:hypothetical protein
VASGKKPFPFPPKKGAPPAKGKKAMPFPPKKKK